MNSKKILHIAAIYFYFSIVIIIGTCTLGTDIEQLRSVYGRVSLQRNVWAAATLPRSYSTDYYSFDVVNGTTYYIWVRDNRTIGVEAADGYVDNILITAKYAYYGSNITLSGGNGANNTAAYFTANQNGTVYLDAGGANGQYRIAYTTVNTRLSGEGNYLSPLTGTVSISGTAKVGHILTAVTSSLGGSGSISYQWMRGGTVIGTISTYTVQAGDVGSTISVTVTRTNNSGSVTSDPTATVTDNHILEIDMVFVPGGTFELGRNLGTGGGSDSPPVSTVTLSGFYMGRYQVTQEQYLAVMGSNPSWFTPANGNPPADGEVQGKRPVEQVSWYNAIVFCNRLSMMEGLTPAYRINGSTNPDDWGAVPTSSNSTWNAVQIVDGSNGYRLPTEAQWEYAAKGGDGSPGSYTYSGSNNVDEVAWYGSNSGSITHEVGKKAPNGLGVYDMSGNVWEWCWDWWGSYTSTAKSDPTGPGSGYFRVIRGGSWDNSAEFTRSVNRYDFSPYGRDDFIGFRVARP